MLRIFIKVIAISWIMLLLIEAGLKFIVKIETSEIQHSSQYGWTLKRNMTRKRECDNYVFKTNKNGFRDKGHAYKKLPNEKRIMFLGDSYAVGGDMTDGHTFIDLFRKKISSDKAVKFDVMNVSVPAWATDQQLLYLQQEGKKYLPDYVFLLIAPNDIRESYNKQFFQIVNGKLRKRGVRQISLKEKVLWALSNYSSSFNYLQRKCGSGYGFAPYIFTLYPVSSDSFEDDEQLFETEESREVTEAKQLLMEMVLRIKEVCNSINCKLILAAIPIKMEFDGSLKKPRYSPGVIARFIKSFAERNNIAYMDLYYDAVNKNVVDEIFIREEFHFNPKGHVFIANAIYAYFQDYLRKNKQLF